MKTDLTYLREMSAGNKDLVLEMIDIFKTQVAEFKVEMKKNYDNGEWVNLGKLAHKAKSSISIMGLEDLAIELKWLETDSKADCQTEKYPQILQHFNEETDVVLEELDEVVQNIENYF